MVLRPGRSIRKTNFRELIGGRVIPIFECQFLARLGDRQVQVPAIPADHRLVRIHPASDVQYIAVVVVVNRVVAVAEVPNIRVVATAAIQVVVAFLPLKRVVARVAVKGILPRSADKDVVGAESGLGSALLGAVQHGRHGVHVVTAPSRAVGKPDLRKLAPVFVIPILDADLLARLANQQVQVPGITSYLDVFGVHSIAKLQDVVPIIIVDRIVPVTGFPDVDVVALASVQNVDPGSSGQGIVSIAALKEIVSVAALKNVRPFFAVNFVVTAVASEHVVILRSLDHIVLVPVIQAGEFRLDVVDRPDRTVSETELGKLGFFAVAPIKYPQAFSTLPDNNDQILAVQAQNQPGRSHSLAELQDVFTQIVAQGIVAVSPVPDVRVVAVAP